MIRFIGLVFLLAVNSIGFSREPVAQNHQLMVQLDRVPQFDQPIEPDQYIIRPGDELTVTFLKANIEALQLTVDPEGRIIHGNLGLFDLSHRTLAQAREELFGALKNLFKIEKIIISINRPLLVRYSIAGAVDAPGFNQGYNSQRVSDAVELAGGVLSDGSTRRIILSGGPNDIAVDLDLAAFTGNFESNPCLYAGYAIYVPQKSGERVQVIGEVNNPREIELQKSDNLSLIISLAGGFRSWADTSNIKIIRGGHTLDARNNLLESGDIIKVEALSDIAEFKNVAIFGAVLKSGRYDSKGASTLGELVKQCGGYDSRAVRARTTVFRFNTVDAAGRISTQRFPIQNVVSGGSADMDFKLAPGDSVYVPFSAGYIEVSGLVAYPGTYPYWADKSAEFYVNLAGGHLPDADRTKIEVFDPISKMTAQFSPQVKIHDGSKIIVGSNRKPQ